MKTIIISSFFVLTAFNSFSQNACPSYFNTASTTSVCGMPGEIKMVYLNGCPGVLPEIDSVYSNGVKANITLANPDNSACSGYNTIRYCLTSGVIPSGDVYVVYFRNPDNSTFKCEVPCTCTVLPVTFSSFTASLSTGKVICNWTTENDLGNNYFLLERSEDGRNFSEVATVSVNKAGKYQATDNTADLTGKTVVFYRVKQVDLDGRFSYTNILSVKLADAQTGVVITPNPFRESVSVSFTASVAGIAEVKIINLAGQMTSSKQYAAVKGANSLLVNGLGGLQRGMYMVQVVVNGAVLQNQKLVKQ